MRKHKTTAIRHVFLPVISAVLCLSISSCKENPTDGAPPDTGERFNFLLTDFEPAWSPDGHTIAYVHGDTVDGQTGIWLVDTNGANKRLFYSGVSAYSPAWSPDGQWVAFSDQAHIWKMKINGDSLTQLTSAGRNFFPAWSPDTHWIAYNESVCKGTGTCGIWLMQANGTKHQFLSAYGNYPDWSSEEMNLLYLTRSVNSAGQAVGDSLWILDILTFSRVFVCLLDGTNYDNRYARYSPDGSRIALTSQPYGSRSQIFIMNSDGTNIRQITTRQGYSCDWSPSGDWIVYTDSDTASGRLWLIRSDGSENHQLTF